MRQRQTKTRLKRYDRVTNDKRWTLLEPQEMPGLLGVMNVSKVASADRRVLCLAWKVLSVSGDERVVNEGETKEPRELDHLHGSGFVRASDRSLERQNVVLAGHHLWLPFPSRRCVLVSKVNESAGRKRKAAIITLRPII